MQSSLSDTDFKHVKFARMSHVLEPNTWTPRLPFQELFFFFFKEREEFSCLRLSSFSLWVLYSYIAEFQAEQLVGIQLSFWMVKIV